MTTHLLSASNDELRIRSRWYIYLRWFILMVVIIPGLISVYVGEGWSDSFAQDAYLGAVALVTNTLFFVLILLLTKRSALKALAITMFVVDIALITYFIYIHGGIESRSVIMYVLPIVTSAAVFGRKGAYVFSLLSILAYDALIVCNYFGILGSSDPLVAAAQTDYANVINSLVFFTSVLILIGVAIDFFVRILLGKEALILQHLEDLRRAQAIAKFGSWEWDKTSDTMIFSDELRRIFGTENVAEPMTFKQYLQRIPSDDKKFLVAEINKASKKQGQFTVDHRITLPNGTVRYIHTNGQSITNSDDIVTRMIGTANDITDAKLLENAKNDFVALTSHQLRTPATIVKQYTTMLDEGYAGELTTKQKGFVKTIYDSNERQIRIINDLLNIARIDSGTLELHPQRTDLVTLLKQITKEHAGKYKTKQQRLIFTRKYKKVLCEIDASQIRMAIDNLLDNAHKYSPDKKIVRIALKRHRSYVTISVADSGIGIPASDVPTIFNIFTRVNNPDALQNEGTGIGLYWTKKIITLHGGTLDVESILHKGTTFSITMPYRVAKLKNNI